MSPTVKERELALTELALLAAAGVDNWEGYNEALNILETHTPTGDSYEDAVALLDALDTAGVDNWEGYRDALEQFTKYAEYVDDVEGEVFLPFDEWLTQSQTVSQVEEDEPVLEVRSPKNEAEEKLHRLIQERFPDTNADELFVAVVEGGFWSRAVFPKEFDIALSKARSQSGHFLVNAQQELLSQVVGNGKFDVFVKQFVQG